MSDSTAIHRARRLFEAGVLPCDCAAVDIGVGVLHEPYCAANGYPKPDDVARVIDEAVAEAKAALRAKTCPTCAGEAMICRACGKSRRDYDHVSAVHAHGPCRGAEMKVCPTCAGSGAVITRRPSLPDDTLKWQTSRVALERLYQISSQINHASVAGVVSLAELGIPANDLRDAMTAALHVLSLEP